MSALAETATDELQALLEMQLALPPEYQQGLSSHLPMALQALAELGADGERLRGFYRHYVRRFEGRRAEAAAAPAVDWQALRGQPGAFEPLRARFAADLAHESPGALLRRVLPALLPGVSGAAFHGVIRVAHAVRAGHAGELAAALAYWGWRWQELPRPRPHPRQAGPRLAPAEWLAALQQSALGWRGEGRLIVQRMRAAVDTSAYHDLGARLAPEALLVPHLNALMAGAYASSANFTVLHLVTGLRAIEVLSPWIDLPAPALADLLGSRIASAWLAAGVGDVSPPPQAHGAHGLLGAHGAHGAVAWPTLIAHARQSNDDHVIKLVHACHGAWTGRPDARFLAAAARALG